MKMLFIFLFVIKLISATPTPIVLWHGMGDTCCVSFSLGGFKIFLEKQIPGVYVNSLLIGNSTIEDLENGYFLNPNTQVEGVCNYLAQEPKLKDGFNAIGFSQGSQFLRAVVQRCGHRLPKIKNLISLGGQHQGVYGLPHCGALSHPTCDYIRQLLNYAAYDTHWQNERPDNKANLKASRREYEDEKDATLKEKIATLLQQTMLETEDKMKEVVHIKEEYIDEKDYRAGFVISMIKKSREVLNELFNVAVRHRDEWMALEQLKIFELIVHTNVDTTNFLKQLVDIQEGRDTFEIPSSFKRPPGDENPSSPDSSPSDPNSSPSDPKSIPSDPNSSPSDPNSSPSNPISSPSEPDSSPSNPISSPSSPISSPTDSISSPSDSISSPSDPGNPPELRFKF